MIQHCIPSIFLFLFVYTSCVVSCFISFLYASFKYIFFSFSTILSLNYSYFLSSDGAIKGSIEWSVSKFVSNVFLLKNIYFLWNAVSTPCGLRCTLIRWPDKFLLVLCNWRDSPFANLLAFLLSATHYVSRCYGAQSILPFTTIYFYAKELPRRCWCHLRSSISF